MKLTKKQRKRLDKAARKAFKYLARYKVECKIAQREQGVPLDEQENHVYSQLKDGSTFIFTEDSKIGDILIDKYKGLSE